uniref:Peptidase S1 domain-containing protein n=1 Tax=Ficedula albicollis TaxID=59894 RepID=A0A803VLG1_FICAL
RDLCVASLAGTVTGAAEDGTFLQPSIIGGHAAESHSRPYMVSLRFQEVHACGAALVHRRWALSAAHCVDGRPWQEGMLLVGLHKWRDPEPGAQRFGIRAACPHPGYDNNTLENDLLLLQLDRKVALSRTRRLISLPRKEPAAGARCSLAGWGDPKRGRLSPTLQEMEVTVMDTRMCNNSRFWRGKIGPAMICFQGLHRGSAPAKGDSGSPLVCGKRPAVAGVMSFGSRDPTDPFKPPVATSTVKYKKWIQKTLRKGCGSGQPEHTGRTKHPFLFTQVGF